MVFMITGVFGGGYLAFVLAKRWSRWWGAVLAVPVSVAVVVVSSFAVASLLSLIESDYWTTNGLIFSATLSLWSVLSTPLGAFIGWRKRGLGDDSKSGSDVQSRPGAFDNLKR